MAKAQKQGKPLRPEVSMVETPEYQLSKFLVNIIKPYIPDMHLLNSTEHFINQFKKFNFSKKQIANAYIVSLFTTVPLSETIEWTMDRLMSSSTNLTKFWLLPTEVYRQLNRIALNHLLSFATTYQCK